MARKSNRTKGSASWPLAVFVRPLTWSENKLTNSYNLQRYCKDDYSTGERFIHRVYILMTDIIHKTSNGLADPQSHRLVNFLREAGLPHENIVADPSERALIVANLPSYLHALPAEVKREARYLSKFVIGAGTGLFDYALNAIWNEVVIDLRKKASLYGLDIFFDAAVSSKVSQIYNSEDDLVALKDVVLLDTCRKLELISDTTYKKLKHILDMRNDIGISHPTNYTISAFELLGWLQTCVQGVLNYRPTRPPFKFRLSFQT